MVHIDAIKAFQNRFIANFLLSFWLISQNLWFWCLHEERKKQNHTLHLIMCIDQSQFRRIFHYFFFLIIKLINSDSQIVSVKRASIYSSNIQNDWFFCSNFCFSHTAIKGINTINKIINHIKNWYSLSVKRNRCVCFLAPLFLFNY